MKAVYQKPLTEVVAYKNENYFMDQSYDHADAKGFSGGWGGGGPQVIENGKMQGKDNLWDD